MAKGKVPKLCTHRSSGKGYVTDPRTRKEVYFGPAGHPATVAKYKDWLRDYLAGQADAPDPPPPGELLVGQLVARYLEHAGGYYRKNGVPTTEVKSIRYALGPVRRLYGEAPCRQFGPACLRAVRDAFVAKGWSRRHVNQQVGRVRSMFRWGVEHELLPPEVLTGLTALAPLKKGRSAAPEGRGVPPVPVADVEATLPHLKPHIADLVRVHLLTGCRAQHAVALRGSDVDRSASPWVYTPSEDKGQHREQRVARIFLGPQAQAILAPRLAKYGDGWLFPSLWRDGGHLLVQGYRQAVTRACARAGVRPWVPLQLRHTALTAVRERYGLDAAQARGGHRQVTTTQVYAERNDALARRVAEETG